MVSKRKLNSRKYKAAMNSTGNRCAYCGKKLIPEERWSLDHVVPVTQGGSDDFSNLVMSCVSCNSMKNNRDPEDWKSYILDDIFSNIERLEKDLKKYQKFINYKLFQKDNVNGAISQLEKELEKIEIKFLIETLEINT